MEKIENEKENESNDSVTDEYIEPANWKKMFGQHSSYWD